MSDTLPVPGAAQRDQKAVQVASVWIAECGLHSSLNIGTYEGSAFDEREAWGTILADLTRHVANAMRDEYGHDCAASIAMIREAYTKELDDPTSKCEGSFVV